MPSWNSSPEVTIQRQFAKAIRSYKASLSSLRADVKSPLLEDKRSALLDLLDRAEQAHATLLKDSSGMPQSVVAQLIAGFATKCAAIDRQHCVLKKS